MRKWTSLPLRLFLDEESLSQTKAANMFGVTQPAISQMCLGDREMVVYQQFDEAEEKLFFRLIEHKEIGIGSLPG